ncbi:MAG TPA: PDZ domain-containing protein [Syntrophobacteria bacterium]|nr:PDZ domain-containing protein [Syntrophobacteria bacterium]
MRLGFKFWQVPISLAVGIILLMPEPGLTAGRPETAAAGSAETVQHPTAEVTFETPRRFATVIELASKRQRLYGSGDVIVGFEGSVAELKILQIDEGRLRIGDPRTQTSAWVAVGSSLPGGVKRLVTGTPKLGCLVYHYVPTAGPLDAEPRVLELQGDHASLTIDIPQTAPVSSWTSPDGRPPSVSDGRPSEMKRQPQTTLLGRVRVKPTGKDAYEVSGTDLDAVLEHKGTVVAETWPKISPQVSLRQGMSLELHSPVADGTLGPRGFQVTSPNLAERGGIEVGDVILAVNGQPINNLADLYRLYQQLQKGPGFSLIQVDLERRGQQLTKTYRVR